MENFKHNLDSQFSNLSECWFGGRAKPVSVKARSSTLPSASGSYDNIFEINIDVAGKTQTWELIFDPTDPMLLPDVIFGPTDEEFIPSLSQIDSATTWDVSKPECLLALLKELYSSYLLHQRERLKEYHQLKDQIQVFLTQYPSVAELSEVHIKKIGPGTYNDTITILVPINVDTAGLPPFLKKANPGRDFSYLVIILEPPNLSNVTATLHLSKRILSALGNANNLRIPVYGSCSFSDYVALIHQLLHNTILFISTGYQERRTLIFSLICQFGRSCLIEVDTDMFLNVSFLLEDKGFHFLLLVSLPENYTKEKPNVIVKALYNISSSDQDNLPCFALDKIKYPKDMEADQILSEIKLQLQSTVEKLKEEVLKV